MDDPIHECNCGGTKFTILKAGMIITCVDCGEPKGTVNMLTGMK